jgi:hypothetical protein
VSLHLRKFALELRIYVSSPASLVLCSVIAMSLNHVSLTLTRVEDQVTSNIRSDLHVAAINEPQNMADFVSADEVPTLSTHPPVFASVHDIVG